MIPITLGALADALPALQRLASARLPYAAAYRLAKLTKAATIEVEHFAAQRDALIKELGHERPTTPDERARGLGTTTHAVLPTSPDWDAFLVRVRELADVPVDLAATPFDPSSVPSLEIAATDLLLLGPLLMSPNGDGQHGE
jgi:hypothetical protein